MRRRILQSTLLVVTITALVLGVPLAITTWRLMEDFSRADLLDRLEQVASRLDGPGSFDRVDQDALALAVPSGGRLTLEEDGRAVQVLGVDVGPNPIAETLPVWPGASITLAEPRTVLRTEQLQVTLVVVLLIVLSVGTGAVVATVTARRLAEPLRDVADRAARLGAGDFRRTPARHGIPELDRVGDVSHQMRSRLTALQLRLDELTAHPDPDVAKEAGAAMEQAERLSGVLDELLQAARAARAAGAEPADLREILAPVVEEWHPRLRAAGRALKVRVPDHLLVRVTPARIREAIGALLENALRHGGGTVGVAARATEHGLQVEVGDGGPGVPEELVAHVFDRGVSVGSSTGLGLALARALVEADGGRLELSRARPPVFTIFLPAARADDVLPAARPAATPR